MRNMVDMTTATEMRDFYIAAELAVLKGQSFRYGDRYLTRADLVEIRKGRQEWEAKAAAETGFSRSRIAIADFSGGRCRGSFRTAP